MKKIDTDFTNKHILIEAGDITVFTNDANLYDCNIEVNTTSENILINKASIRKGTFNAIKVLENFQFCKASFENVQFLGNYSGCDFGTWEKNHGSYGKLHECDFSKVDYIHNCRFFNCKNGSVLFPRWPHVTISNSDSLQREIAKITWPGKIGIMMKIIANIPDDCTFVVINSATLVKKLGGSLDGLKESFNKLPLADY